MKIKEVMERTGLTDRAIRHYIECGLLIPHSDDGYMGRKNYVFTREDVERLQMIKTLREAGFGIEQIRELLDSRSVRSIVRERLSQLESEKRQSERLLDVLQKADIDREVSFEELMVILSANPVRSIDPEEIYAPTPIQPKTYTSEERLFAMRSSWWRKVDGETTVEIKDSVRGVITKMRQQQDASKDCGRRFRCTKRGRFSLRDDFGTVGLRGGVYTQNGKTYIRFYEVYEPLWTVLLIVLIIFLLPLVMAMYLYYLFTGNVFDFVLDLAGDYRLLRDVKTRQDVLCELREDMLQRLEVIRRWDE